MTPHPVDFAKSPQMSVVAGVAGVGCGQDTVAPPTDVAKSDGKEEKETGVRDLFGFLSDPEISFIIPSG